MNIGLVGGTYGPGHRCLDLGAAEGMLLIDIVEGKIAHVEVLNRDEVRRKLLVPFPSELRLSHEHPEAMRRRFVMLTLG